MRRLIRQNRSTLNNRIEPKPAKKLSFTNPYIAETINLFACCDIISVFAPSERKGGYVDIIVSNYNRPTDRLSHTDTLAENLI